MEGLGFDEFDGLFLQPSMGFGPVGDELLLQELFKSDFDLELEPLAQVPVCTGTMNAASPATSASEASHIAAPPSPPAAPQQPVLIVRQTAARGPGTKRAAVLPPPSQPAAAPVPPASSAESEPPRIVTTAPPPTVPAAGLAGRKLRKVAAVEVTKPVAMPVPPPPALSIPSTSPSSASGSVSPACSVPSPMVAPVPTLGATSAAPAAAVKAVATCTASAKPVRKAAVVITPGNSATRHQQQSEDMDTDSEDSNDTEEDGMNLDGTTKVNKRKAPEVDWRSIEDPAERRRQRRLAKNRVTAARSRERKKVQWTDMEARLNGLEADNQQLRAMLEAMTRENSGLREQLDRLVSGRGGASTAGNSAPASQGQGVGTSNESAALVFIAILLLLVSTSLPGEQVSSAALALGGAAPLLLLAQLLAAGEEGSSPASPAGEPAHKKTKQDPAQHPTSSSPSPSSGASPLWQHLAAFLAALRTLLARAPKRLAKAVHRALYARHHFMPRAAFNAVASASSAAIKGLGASGLLPRVKPEAMVC